MGKGRVQVELKIVTTNESPGNSKCKPSFSMAITPAPIRAQGSIKLAFAEFDVSGVAARLRSNGGYQIPEV